MADGKVEIKVNLDGKSAQAEAKSLKSMLGDITQGANKTGGIFKSMLGANIIGSALTNAIGGIQRGVVGLATELNNSSKAWKTFEGNMEMIGRTPQQISQAKKAMQDYATTTIYSASDMAQTYSQLAAVGIEGTEGLVKGFGGLAAAAENPAQAMKTLSQQAVQMAAKPNVAWQDFKLMLEQTPAGISAVAKEMGMSTADMVKAVQNGQIATEDFFKAVDKVGNSKAFAKMATEFKTIDQAIDGAKETLSNKLLPVFDVVNKHGIKAVDGLSDAIANIDFGNIAGKLDTFLSGLNFDGLANIGSKIFGAIQTNLASFGQAFNSVMTAFNNTGAIDKAKAAFDSLLGAYNNVVGAVGGASAWTTLGTALGNIVTVASEVATAIGDFVAGLDPSTIQAGTNAAIALGAAILGLRTGLSVVNGIKTAFEGIKTAINIGKSIGGLVANFLGLAGAQTTAAASSGAMAAGNTAVGTTAGASAASVMKLGAAVLMVGGGIALAAAGVWVLVQAAVQIAGAGTSAQVALALMAVGIVALGAAAALAGGMLTAGAIGIIAFGAAVALIGIGVGAASAGIALLCTQLPIVAQYGLTAAVGLAAIGSALLVVGAGALVAGAGLAVAAVGVTAIGLAAVVAAAGAVALGAGLLVAAGGVAAFGAALNVSIPAINALSAAANSLISALSSGIATVLNSVAGVIDSVGTSAQRAGQGFKSLAQGVVAITNTSLRDMAASLAAAATGVAAIAAAADGMGKAGTQFRLLGQGLVTIQASGAGAQVILSGLAGVVPSLSASMSSLAPSLTLGATALMAFGASVTASLAGLSASGAMLGAFSARAQMLGASLASAGSQVAMLSASLMLVGASSGAISGQVTTATASITTLRATIATVPSSFMKVGLSATQATMQIRQMGTAAPLIGSAMRAAASAVQSAMSSMTQAVSIGGQRMVQIGQQSGQRTGQGFAMGIQSGRGAVSGAVGSLVATAVSRAASGAGAMRGVGYQVGAGLAAGMMGALGAVTAAANALIAQAERAAQAKARIHSPSRLFRDNVGRYIPQGVAVGIEKNTDSVTKSIDGMYGKIEKYKARAESLIGTKTGDLSSTVRAETSAKSYISQQVEIIKQQTTDALGKALEVAKKAVERPINLDINGRRFAEATGGDMTKWQSREAQLKDRMRGIK